MSDRTGARPIGRGDGHEGLVSTLEESRPRTFLSHSLVLMVCSGGSSVLSAVYLAGVGRLLGPAEFGQVTAVLALAYLFFLTLEPIEGGISKFAATYHGERSPEKQATLSRYTLRRLSFLAGAGLLIWLPLSWPLRAWLHFESVGVLLWFTAFAVLALLTCSPRGVLRGDHRFGAFGLNQVTESLVRLSCGLSAVALGAGAGGALAGYAVGTGAALLLGLIQLRDLGRRPGEPIDTGRMYAFSLPLLCVHFYSVFVVNVDVLVAKWCLTETDAGRYGAASTLARFLSAGVTPILFVLFSHVASRHAQGRSVRRLVLRVGAVLSAGLLVAAVLLWLASGAIVRIVFGSAFAGSEQALRIMWTSASLLVLQMVVLFVLLGMDRARGIWALILPCVIQAILLGRFHASAAEIAGCSLAAACAGLVVLFVLVLSASSAPSKPTDPGRGPGA